MGLRGALVAMAAGVLLMLAPADRGAASAAAPPTAPTGSDGFTRMRIDSSVLVYEDGRVTMRVTCVLVAASPCRGVVRIRQQRTGARGLLLADDTFTAPPGGVRRIRVRPTAAGRALFRMRSRVCTAPFLLHQGGIVQGYLPLVTPRRTSPSRTAAGNCFEQRV